MSPAAARTRSRSSTPTPTRKVARDPGRRIALGRGHPLTHPLAPRRWPGERSSRSPTAAAATRTMDGRRPAPLHLPAMTAESDLPDAARRRALRRVAAGALALVAAFPAVCRGFRRRRRRPLRRAVDLLAHPADERRGPMVRTAAYRPRTAGTRGGNPRHRQPDRTVARFSRPRRVPGTTSTRRSSAARGASVAHQPARTNSTSRRSTHWHGLTIDTRNDGNGESLIAPGGRFDYRVHRAQPRRAVLVPPAPARRDRAPGLSRPVRLARRSRTTTRAHCGAALELVPGETEIPLVLHERAPHGTGSLRAARRTTCGSAGSATCRWSTAHRAPTSTSPTRRYRLRILNAANARTYRLASSPRRRRRCCPSSCSGTDGGLLEQRAFAAPKSSFRRRSASTFWSTSPAIGVGGFVLLESARVRPDARGAGAPRPERVGIRATSRDGAIHGAEAGGDPVAGAAPAATAPRFRLMQFRVRERRSPIAPHRRRACPRRSHSCRERRRRASAASRVSPRGAGGSTTGSTTRRRRRSSSRATRRRPGCCATTTRACRTRCTCTASSSACSGARPARTSWRRSPSTTAGRLATDLGWKDTVLVWPGESVRIAIDFRHPFAGEQIYLVHCHNLEHEDAGMMLRVRVG